MPRYKSLRSFILPAWILALSVFTWLLKGTCALQNSEDTVVYLLGQWAPTPFYPGSNRFGNLLPLSTFWLHNLLVNANVQLFLRVFAGFAAPALASVVLFTVSGKRNDWIAKNFVALLYLAVVFVQFSYSSFYVLWPGVHPYSLSLALLMLGAFLYQRLIPALGKPAGFFLVLVALWVNPSSAILIAGFLLVHLTLQWRTLEPLVGHEAGARSARMAEVSVVLLLGVCVTYASHFYAGRWPELSRSFSSQDYARISLSFAALRLGISNLLAETGGVVLLVELLAVLTLVGLRFTGLRTRLSWLPETGGMTRDVELSLLVTSLGYAIFSSQLAHVQSYASSFRYFLPSAMTIVLLLVSRLYAMLAAALARSRFTRPGLAGIGCLLAPLVVLGFSYHRYEGFGGPCKFDVAKPQYLNYATIALAGDYCCVIGSYWDVWETGFQAELLREKEPAPGGAVYPMSYRAEIVADRITARIRHDLATTGSTRVLCVNPVRGDATANGNSCEDILLWNTGWGNLPWTGVSRHFYGTGAPPYESFELRPMVLQPDHVVEFRRSGDGSALLFSGWYPPEGDWTWTRGRKAEIVFALGRIPSSDIALDFQVKTDIGKLVSPPVNILVRIELNDRYLTTWSLDPDSGTQRIQLPSAWLTTNCNFLTFESFGPGSARELGSLASDDRPHGIAFGSMVWDGEADSGIQPDSSRTHSKIRKRTL